MRVFMATDFRIVIKNNKYYAKEKFSTNLMRYYESFGKIDLFCREDNVSNEMELVDITKYINSVFIADSLLKVMLGKYNKEINNKVEKSDFIILRCFSFICVKVFKYMKKYEKTYLAEVMNCAWDSLWNHSLKGKIVAPYIFFKTKEMILDANYVTYVTEKFLQNRYPCKCKYASISDVDILKINEEDILKSRNNKIKEFSNKKEIKIMTIGATNVKFKAQKYVIKAIKKLKKDNIKIKYYLAGGGDTTRLRRIAKRCKVLENILFLGELNRIELFSYLDNIDIYVHPSLQEGLPRSVVEAMSRACPVIGATTGGIPELISKKFLVKRKSSKDIYNKIKYYCNLNEEQRKKVSLYNLEKTKKFNDLLLHRERKKYYKYIKKQLIN